MQERLLISMNLNEMVEYVHKVNVDHGWFDKDRPFSADIALLHSEVSEVYEAAISNRILESDEYNSNSFGAELADILIRLLDTCYRYDAEIRPFVSGKLDYGLISDNLMQLNCDISQVYESYRKSEIINYDVLESALNKVHVTLRMVALTYDIDLDKEFELKMKYNENRSYRHGGKVE